MFFLRGGKRKVLQDQGIPSSSQTRFTIAEMPRLHMSTNIFRESVPSVFSEPFPEQDGTLSILKASTQKCAVQVNGKVKLVLDIPLLPTNLKNKELERWIIKEILRSPEAITKFYGAMDIKKAKKVIVVKGGKTVNFVL
jgi:leucyl-tRNA synthetase